MISIFTKLLVGDRIKQWMSQYLGITNINKVRTQRIRELIGEKFWRVRKRNPLRWYYKEKVIFEEVYYGVFSGSIM